MCRGIRKIDSNKIHKFTTAFALQRILSKRTADAKSPPLHDSARRFFLGMDFSNQRRVCTVWLRIKTIIAEHIETLFGNVNDQTFDEIISRYGFHDLLVILMALIPEGDLLAIITGDSKISDLPEVLSSSVCEAWCRENGERVSKE